MLSDFKVYKRKIHVWQQCPDSQAGKKYRYFWSTNAYRTCREAVARAQELHPGQEFKANFSKD